MTNTFTDQHAQLDSRSLTPAPTVLPIPTPPPSSPVTHKDENWRVFHARRLMITDVLAMLLAVLVAQYAVADFDWAQFTQGLAQFAGEAISLRSPLENPSLISVVVLGLWTLCLAGFGTRDPRVMGTGTTEYRRIVDASILLFAVFAITCYAMDSDVGRSYVLFAFPLGIVLLIVGRLSWRRWLKARRRAGEYSARVLLVGSFESVVHITRELSKQPAAGYLVVGAVVPTGLTAGHLPGTKIPVVGHLKHLEAALKTSGADTVAITSSDELTPKRIRELSWSLEPGRQHLIVAPSLTDIGGPRIHMRPVAGFPLIHVETPRFDGKQLIQKRIFDILVSGALIVFFAPLLLVVSMSVRLSTPGSALFRQTRVGLQGTTFSMLKFRSMVINAEEVLENLKARQREEGNSVLFKMKDDPRITPIGSFLRRFSIDELPQLFNVFKGDMSLIGPRPPLLTEVDQYEQHVHRRFLMKPGITGLWQVSGRSNLSWEESVRLDLYYVENWSMLGDIAILWRTARAVLARDGAY
ncbi:MAG: sugar transferase [Rhodoglobus sp.]